MFEAIILHKHGNGDGSFEDDDTVSFAVGAHSPENHSQLESSNGYKENVTIRLSCKCASYGEAKEERDRLVHDIDKALQAAKKHFGRG